MWVLIRREVADVYTALAATKVDTAWLVMRLPSGRFIANSAWVVCAAIAAHTTCCSGQHDAP